MEKVSKVIIPILVLVLASFTYQYYQSVQKEQRQWQVFVNQLYFSINSSIDNMDNLIVNKPTNEQLDDALRQLEQDLLRTQTILEDGNMFLDEEIYRPSFFREATYFLYGLKLSGKVSADIPPFAKDGRLDEEEISLLTTLYGFLKSGLEEMHSSETGQENPDIKLNELNRIIMTHFNYNLEDIVKEAR